MLVFRSLSALVLLFLLSITEAAQKPHIAILDLEGTLATSELVTLTNKLSVVLTNTGKYVVIERSQMQEVLKEQGFQQSGCTSTECAVEVGRLLGVGLMVAGNIGKVGTVFSISLRMISVQTGAITKSVSTDFRGSIEDVLITGIPRAASALMAAKQRFVDPNSPLSGTGDIYIASTPTGADIYLDSKIVEGRKTPTTIQSVAAGDHMIELRKGILVGSQAVSLHADDLAKLHVHLERGNSSLIVISDPPEATLYLDGKPKGKTPSKIESLPAGTHTMRIVKDGYFPYSQTLSLAADQSKKLSFILQPAAYLSVRSRPEGAKILVDSVKVGDTPLDRILVKPGPRVITISAPDHKPFRKRVDFAPNEVRKIDEDLRYSYGRLNVTTNPQGAIVLLDSASIGRAPLKVSRIEPGSHIISILAPNHDTIIEHMQFAAGQTHVLDHSLPYSFAKLRVTTNPPNAVVFLNSTSIGTTPLLKDHVTPGHHVVKLALSKYDTIAKAFNFTKGHTAQFHEDLEYSYATLHILAHGPNLRGDPQQLHANISLNSDPVGITPFFSDTLAPGNYDISLSLQNHRTATRSLSLAKGKTDSLVVQMHYTDQYTKLLHKQRLAKRKKLKRFSRNIVALATIATGSIAGYSGYKTSMTHTDYDKAETKASATSLGDKMDKRREIAIQYGAVTGVLLTLSVVLSF